MNWKIDNRLSIKSHRKNKRGWITMSEFSRWEEYREWHRENVFQPAIDDHNRALEKHEKTMGHLIKPKEIKFLFFKWKESPNTFDYHVYFLTMPKFPFIPKPTVEGYLNWINKKEKENGQN